MKIAKEAQAQPAGAPLPIQLEQINALAKAKLEPEELYVFAMRLCDDQVDRDYERFDTGALPQLAKLFVGKTGVLDHCWQTDSQVARIFDTQLVQEKGVSYIKAWAYIRRGGENDAIIADIEAGIKKEVSVGCAMARRICSICGSEYGACGHQKGEHYDGALCCAILAEPVDAYEFSFVAVPAQPSAGVLKGLGPGRMSLKALAQAHGAQAEYEALEKQAQLGRQYRRELEDQVVRLGLSLGLGVTEPVLRNLARSAGEADLDSLRQALSRRLEEQLPVVTQLNSRPGRQEEMESGFLI